MRKSRAASLVVAVLVVVVVAAFQTTKTTTAFSTTSRLKPKWRAIQQKKTKTTTNIYDYMKSSLNDKKKEDDAQKRALASQLESLVANARKIIPRGTTTTQRQKQEEEEEKQTSEIDNNKQKEAEAASKRGIIIQSLAAGLAVSLAMIPEAVAFSFVAGVNPLVGLWTTVILGFFAATFGGRAGICSSASGACSVVVAPLAAAHGPAYLPLCAILAGFIQIMGGSVLGLGKFIRLVPHPVMLGFVNGLALVMTQAQLVHFMDGTTGTWMSIRTAAGAAMYGITALTIFLVRILPRIPFLRSIPASLGAVTITTIVARSWNLPVKTLADVAGSDTFRGGLAVLPRWTLPTPATIPLLSSTSYSSSLLHVLRIVAPYAITMAAVGCIESLLTMQLMDGIADDGKRGSTEKECFGQGLGNVMSGLTGGIGGCALLGQSLINVQSGGGQSRLSGMSMAIFLALGIVLAAPLLGTVPVSSLVGVMLLVCQSTFSWSSLRILGKIPRLDAIVIALVSFVTVRQDLAKAVVAGTIASALGFAWRQSTLISAKVDSIHPALDNTNKNSSKKENADDDALMTKNKKEKEEKEDSSWKVYTLSGPIFFGSTLQFASIFDVKNDPNDVIIDFTDARVMDHSALEAVNDISDRYGLMGKTVHLRHLSSDCAQLLSRLHGNGNGLPPYEVIESDPEEDPIYQVVEESSVYEDINPPLTSLDVPSST